MQGMRWRAVGTMGIVAATCSSARAARAAGTAEIGTSAPFQQGRGRVSFQLGSSFASGNDYLMLGAGAGYYLIDDLELGLDYELWLLGDPTLQRLSPGLRYVFDLPSVKPYLGVFYRHTFVSNFSDIDQLGARAGIYFVSSPAFYAGLGLVYERVLSCKSDTIVECDSIYPEISIGFSF
jgi:hypothetical protein